MSTGIDARLRTLTLVLAAMLVGIAALTGVFLYLKPAGPLIPVDQGHLILLAVMAGMALMESPVFFAVRALKVAELRKRIDGAGGSANAIDLPQEYFTLTLIPAALAEGFALFGAIIYFLTGSPLGLLGPVLGMVVIIALLPTRFRYDNFIETVTRRSVM